MSYPNQQPQQQQHQHQQGYPPQGYNPQHNPHAGGYGAPQPGGYGSQQQQQQPGPVQRPGETPAYQSTPSYGQSQQPGQPQYGNGAYGQNQGYQQQDQQQYTNQQQPGANGYPPQQQPQQYAQAQPATGQVMVTTQVTGGLPPLLVCFSDQRDVYYLMRYNTLFIVIICVALFIFCASILNFIVGVGTWWTGLLVAASLLNIVFFAWYTHETKINFEHDSKVVRVTEKRLFQHFCQETTLEQVNYRQLGDAGYTGSPSVAGELYIDLGDKRLFLGQRMYQTELQIASDVEPWRAYLRRLREMDGGPGGLVSQITNAVTSTVARL